MVNKYLMDEEIAEVMRHIDGEKMLERLMGVVSKIRPKQIDHQFASMYSEHNNSDYHRGMFIDARCQEAKVHSYGEMRHLLDDLIIQYPSDAQLFSTGKSEGYRSSDNALDVVGIQIFAIEEPKQTAFFVSGHHADEWSGSETAYLVAKGLLESYHEGNPNVHKMRKNTHLVFIPQIDADLYAQPNFENVTELSYEEYLERGYSRLNVEPDHIVTNYYRDEGAGLPHPIYVLNQTLPCGRLPSHCPPSPAPSDEQS